jgi:hypothetical protein
MKIRVYTKETVYVDKAYIVEVDDDFINLDDDEATQKLEDMLENNEFDDPIYEDDCTDNGEYVDGWTDRTFN